MSRRARERANARPWEELTAERDQLLAVKVIWSDLLQAVHSLAEFINFYASITVESEGQQKEYEFERAAVLNQAKAAIAKAAGNTPP